MLAKRIIPCLDIDDGRVKKGINFKGLVDVGDPVAVAAKYEQQGADEIVFLDITATNERRATMTNVVRKVAEQVFVPFTVGGGINSVKAMQNMLKAGADKVSINSQAVKQPELITAGAKKFGRQCIVLAIDVKWDAEAKFYRVYTHGGSRPTNLNAIEWAQRGVRLGAGELLVTSMDRDGTEAGYDIELYRQLNKAVNVPIIASGGVGKSSDFTNLFEETNVDGALAASIFHYDELTIADVKAELRQNKVVVR